MGTVQRGIPIPPAATYSDRRAEHVEPEAPRSSTLETPPTGGHNMIKGAGRREPTRADPNISQRVCAEAGHHPSRASDTSAVYANS